MHLPLPSKYSLRNCDPQTFPLFISYRTLVGHQKLNVHGFQDPTIILSYDSVAGGSSLARNPSHVPAAAVPNPANVAKSEGATIVAPRH